MNRFFAALVFFVGCIPAIATLDLSALDKFVTPLRLKQDSHPVYPEAAVRDGIEGEVVVHYTVGFDGKVRDVKTWGDGPPILEAAAIAAMQTREYEPFTRKKEIEEPWVVLCYEFRLPRAAGEQPTVTRVKLPADRWRDNLIPGVYPFEMLKKKKSGKAEVMFLVGPDGRPQEIKVTESTHKEFALAVEAMTATVRMAIPRTRTGRYQPTYLFHRAAFSADGKTGVPIGDLTRRLAFEPEANASVFSPEAVDEGAVRLSGAEPEYPVKFKKKKLTGQAALLWAVDEEGVPQAIQIISATKPEFGYAAVQAVSQWKYQPARKAGEAVPVWERMVFTFEAPK